MSEGTLTPILVIEDSHEDFEVLVRGFNKAGFQLPLYRCKDGQEALDFIYKQGSYADSTFVVRPALILLDLNMPGLNGFNVLKSIKGNEDIQTIPVIVFSTSNNVDDIQQCYTLGANSYIQKPESLQAYVDTASAIKQYWFNTCKLPK